MYKKRRKLIFSLFVLSLSVVALVICMVCVSSINKTGNRGNSSNTETTEEVTELEEKIKVACIGDSITYGYGVTNLHTDNYPDILQDLLGDDYYVANFGHSGACVNPEGDNPYINQNVYRQSMEFEADIIIFMLGTNDAKTVNWEDEYAFMRNYLELIDSYCQGDRQPKVYIALCAEGYNNADPNNVYHIQPTRIDKIVETIRNTHIENAEIIDIHSLTEAHPEWFVKDGVHPSSDGARGIAELIAEVIKENEE